MNKSKWPVILAVIGIIAVILVIGLIVFHKGADDPNPNGETVVTTDPNVKTDDTPAPAMTPEAGATDDADITPDPAITLDPDATDDPGETQGQGATLIDDQGDIIIVIPSGQDSGGL